MGVGAQRKTTNQAPTSSSSTSFQAQEVKKIAPVIVQPKSAAEASLPPSYDHSEILEFEPNALLLPTTDHDLSYFNSLASGDRPTHMPSSYALVMNVFRTTQLHVFPLAERIALGSSLKQPFYSVLSSPSLSSSDEYNKLTISRRNPDLARWTDCCVSEIQPKLKLLAAGVMIIARVDVKGNPKRAEQRYTLTWEKSRDAYTVWKDVSVSQTQPVLDLSVEGWESLEDACGEGGGVIRAKSRTVTAPGASHHDLAVLDATKPSLQLISTSAEGHQLMDLVTASMLTVMVVHTRMCKLGRAAMAAKSAQGAKPPPAVVVMREYHVFT